MFRTIELGRRCSRCCYVSQPADRCRQRSSGLRRASLCRARAGGVAASPPVVGSRRPPDPRGRRQPCCLGHRFSPRSLGASSDPLASAVPVCARARAGGRGRVPPVLARAGTGARGADVTLLPRHLLLAALDRCLQRLIWPPSVPVCAGARAGRPWRASRAGGACVLQSPSTGHSPSSTSVF